MSAAKARTEALIHAYYDAFNRADMPAFLALLSENVEHDINQGERQTGRDVFSAFMEKMNRSYREELKEIRVVASEDGSWAAAEFVVHGTYLATDEGLPEANGQTYKLAAGAFFNVEDNKVARITNYYNLRDWLAQVGA
ncbi:ketosteroid isomerase-related protein [Pokkaliibacter sp. CJK22405]|uniref:ketosteroid isomerase-related protein n=1 Tax=Pokkaliibacter sp. CJK22405 TaxID=3384615 RepID=UPI0039855D01